MSSSTTTSVSTNETAMPDYTPEAINEHARRTFATVGVVMVLSGVLGNLLFLTVLFQQFRRKHSVHILFLANLSLADLLTVGYWFSFFVLDFILFRHPVVDHVHCVFNGVVIITLYQVCVYFLVSISLNRYLHVCHTHLYKRVFTLPRTVAWCVCVWVVSLLVAIVPVWDNSSLYGYSPITRFCSYSRDGVSYVKVLLLTLAILPMALGAYCNIAIYCHWRKLRLSSLKRYPLATRGDKERKGRVLARWVASVKRRTAGAAKEVEDGHGKNCVEAKSFETPVQVSTASENKRDKSGGDERASSNTASTLETHNSTTGERKHEVLSVHAEIHHHQFTDRVAEDKKSSSTSLSSSSSSSESDEDSESAESWNNENAINAGLEKQPASVYVSQDTSDRHPQNHRLDDDIRAAVTSSAVSTSPTPGPASRGPKAIGYPLTHKKHHHHHHHHHQHKAKQNGQAGKAAQQGGHSGAKSHKAREVAFIRSLFVVFILAGVTLVPYAVMTILKDYIDLSTELVIFGNFFLLFNNSLNWIVYGVMNLSFRRGYVQNTRKIFTVCCPSKFRNTREEKSFDFSSTPSALRVLTRNDVSSSTSQISPGNS